MTKRLTAKIYATQGGRSGKVQFISDSSQDMCDSATRKKDLGRVLRYRILHNPQNARAAGGQAVSR